MGDVERSRGGGVAGDSVVGGGWVGEVEAEVRSRGCECLCVGRFLTLEALGGRVVAVALRFSFALISGLPFSLVYGAYDRSMLVTAALNRQHFTYLLSSKEPL
jgi:hypothetical protein